MRKIIALFLVFSVLSLSVNLMAKERRGADLVIYKTDGQLVKGELIAVKENSLLLKESSSGADVMAIVGDMKTIIIVKKSRALEQGALGLLIGGVVGFATGSAILYTKKFFGIRGGLSPPDVYDHHSRPYGLVGAASGAVAGVMAGTSAGKDKTIRIEGKSYTEIKKVLDYLRKKSRVPDFQ